jgi:hypothetical protein
MVAQTVIIKIEKAQHAARFQRILQMTDDAKAFRQVVLQDKADPDEIEHAEIVQRFSQIVKEKVYARLVAVAFPGV